VKRGRFVLGGGYRIQGKKTGQDKKDQRRITMRLYTIQRNNEQQFDLAIEGCDHKLYLLQELGFDFADMNELIRTITDAELAELKHTSQTAALLHELHALCFDEVHLCAPIVHPRQDILCLGINYDEHIKEVDAPKGEYTVYFSKRVEEGSGAFDPIPSYAGYVESLDYEVELAVILRKDVKAISADSALEAVFGYTVINDVSARNLQFRHQQWYLGKSLDGFAPMGPCIVTADEIEDVQNLAISCTVNREVRQSSNTQHMIQPVANAIAELSQGITLKAGTIIATGTPGGVAMGMKPPVWLKAGDVVECEIEKIGKLKNTVV
jgi:2-keto-4-pentenoate hydratase/2-oxohepta-3-ene-1,7-dioic acid hydratase in catechol pathway